MNKILFGGGSFWCLEPAFAALRGVDDVVPGYAGGTVPNPSREVVQTGLTGHIEVVQITYQPQEIALSLLLRAFFHLHEPTAPPTVGEAGRQFSSVIYCTTEKQHEQVRLWLKVAARRYEKPLQTQLGFLQEGQFWLAEPQELQYFFRHGQKDKYCIEHVRPVLRHFVRDFWSHLHIPADKRLDNPLLSGHS